MGNISGKHPPTGTVCLNDCGYSYNRDVTQKCKYPNKVHKYKHNESPWRVGRMITSGRTKSI